jgi:hypothetical protein
MKNKKESEGFSRVIAVALLAFVTAGALYGAGEIANWSNTQNGTVRINRVSAGVNSLEVDTLYGDNCTITGTLVAGTFTGSTPVFPTTADATTTIVLTSADYGTTTLVSSNAAVAVTLPANGAAAGSWLEVAVIGTDACAPTISAATADTLIGPNDVDLDSVTWATGHRINAVARFWSDGSFWHVQNLGGTTMTYTD